MQNPSSRAPRTIRRALTNEERASMGGYPEIVSHLLFHRGITDAETAGRFLAPDYDRDVHDPLLLKDAEKAALRIIRAIETDELFAIYSDYDADGIPGAAIWNDFLARIGYKNFIVYIPHRHNEGFGLNIDAVDELSAKGVKLIVTVDCGITDAAAVDRANEKGIEVIITDHHEPPPELPKAFAIIDHKQADCAYPDKNLCGSGVAFKLIQGIIKKAKEEGVGSKEIGESIKKAQSTTHEGLRNFKEGHEKWLLDLVGMATLSDMVPLVGENRALAYYGLSVMRKSPRKGLMKLFSKLKMSQKHVTEDDIAFMITPRINAASRMGLPMDAFHLLAAENEADADTYAIRLNAVNDERKGVVATLVKEVKKTVHERHGSAESMPSVIVLGNPEWRPSLLGLAANSCAEEFDRPVFLWGRDGGNDIKGSCRSEGRSSVVEIMRAVPTGIFTQFGGHKHSGGFGVLNEQIHFLEQRLNEAAQKIGAGQSEGGGAEGSIDAELTLDMLDRNMFTDVMRLAPFGVGNPKPLFLFKKILPVSIRMFGKAQEHVELSFAKSSGSRVGAIAFFSAGSEWAKALQPNKPIDLVASLEKSMFRGREELRLRVVDVIFK